MLRHATIKQHALPELGELTENVAVISTRTLRTLASTIKWGYDTTHKYVTVFCALNLLRKFKHNHELHIVFPLGKYQPPANLQALDSLITQSRTKVRQFTRKVKERFLSLNLLPTTQMPGHEELQLADCDTSIQQALFKPMLEVIRSEGIDIAKGQHIAQRLVNEVITKIALPLQAYRTNEKSLPGARTATQPGVQKQSREIYSGKSRLSMPESTIISTQNSDENQKVYHDGRLGHQKVYLQTIEKSTRTEKSTPDEKKVYLSEEKGYSNHPQAVDSVTQLLYAYSDLLEDTTINWQDMWLPRDFFEELYEQMNSYHLRLHNFGLLSHTKGHIWKSVELSIIKKIASLYQVDSDAACEYIFQCTGREYVPQAPQKIAFYSAPVAQQKTKKFSRNEYPEDWYQPPANRETQFSNSLPGVVDSQNHQVDYSKVESTAKQRKVDYSKVESTVDYTPVDSSLPDSTPSVDSTLSVEVTPQNMDEIACEADANTNSNYFFDLSDNKKPEKVLRIPTQLDSETYGEEFSNVIRKRNINILFNKINNNVTLRRDAAKFITQIFDDKNTERVQKMNESLLAKYKPETIINGLH
ncbi:hypothetical protein KDW_37860 [Dictyobacter vulcani]|uniref:Uncharacterized protein n=1 Tax=Dictyobacter vulcani TaxID=2607529 RepID=A0A5J4KJF5_9CHLR|nr:hypothetical protein [Dictyobacter vulcani]GER89624.1 hypothetical protein KDW_37860 [Dictyobacter vulcani]